MRSNLALTITITITITITLNPHPNLNPDPNQVGRGDQFRREAARAAGQWTGGEIMRPRPRCASTQRTQQLDAHKNSTQPLHNSTQPCTTLTQLSTAVLSAVPISAGKTDDFLGEVHIELPDEIHASG